MKLIQKPECLIDNDDIWLSGRKRLEQALDFTTSICKESGLVNKPVWNPKYVPASNSGRRWGKKSRGSVELKHQRSDSDIHILPAS